MSEWDELTNPVAPAGEASSWDEVTYKPAAPPPDYLMRPPEPQFGKGRMAGVRAMGHESLAQGADTLATPGKIIAAMVGVDPEKADIEFAGIPLTGFAKDQRAESKYERGIQQANTPQGGAAQFGTELLDSAINMAPSVITGLVTKKGDLGLGVMGAQVFSTEMTRSLNEGKTNKEALKDAAIATALELTPEKAFGFFDDLPVAKGVKAWLRQIVAESISEAATETGTILDERYRQQKDIGTFWDTLMRTGKAGAAGAIMGGGFGAGALLRGRGGVADQTPPIDPVEQMINNVNEQWRQRMEAEAQVQQPPTEPPAPPTPPPVRPDIPQPTVIDPVEEARARVASMAGANPVIAAMQQAEAVEQNGGPSLEEVIAKAQEEMAKTNGVISNTIIEFEKALANNGWNAQAEAFKNEVDRIEAETLAARQKTAPVREFQPVQQEPTPVQESTEAEEVPFYQWENQPLPPKPPTLLEYLAANKVRLDSSKFGGNLATADDNVRVGNKWLFEGKLLRKDGKGMGPDDLLEFLVEEGFMLPPDPNTPTQIMANDAIEMLNDALRGNDVRSLNDEVAWQEYDDAVRFNDELEQARLEAEETIPGSKWEDLAPALDEVYKLPPDLTDAEIDALAEQYASREEENVDQGTEEAVVPEGLGIPEATPEETNQAAEQAKTAERNRLGEDVVPVESGPGELFAGNEPGVRPEQTSLADRLDEMTQEHQTKANLIEETQADTVESLMERAASTDKSVNRYKEVKGQGSQLVVTTFAQSKDGQVEVQRTENTVTGRVTHTFWRGDQRIGKTKAAEILGQQQRSANKIVTDEAADAARDRLKSKLGTVRSGVDPEMYKDMLILAGYHVEKGARTAAALAKALIQEFPNLAKWINENAERLWNDINQQEKAARTPPKPPPKQPAAPQAAKGPYRPTGPTSTKNAARDAERAARMADPIFSEYFKSNADVVEDAMAAMADNPNLAEEVIEDLLTNQYPSISRLTEAILVVYKTDVRRAMREQADRMLDENASQSARNIATAKYEDLLLRNNEIDLATSSSGAVWGGIGQFRKRWMEQDYTFVAQVAETARLIGQKPSKQQEAVIKQLTDRIAELETEVERANRKAQDAIDKHHAQATIDAIYKESQKQAKIPRGKRIDAAIQAELAAIRAGTFGTFGAGIPASQLAHLAKLGGLLIAKGANTFAKWTQAMRDALGAKIFGHVEGSLKELWEMALDEHLAIEAELSNDTVETLTAEAEALAEAQEPISHAVVYKLARAFVLQGMKTENEVMAAVTKVIQEFYPDISEREVRQIFSQYGQAKYPSQAADKKTLRELRVLVRLQESIDRLQEGLDPKRTGPQRDKATQEIRDKQKVLNSLMRKRALENPVPSKEKLASIDEQRITRLQNQIADLEKQLATGQKPVKGEPVPDSAEVTRLKAKRDALKKRIKEIEDAQKVKLTPEEKYNELRAKQLRKQLAEVARRIRENDYTPKQRKEPPPLSKENMDLVEELMIAKKKLHEQQMKWRRSQFNWAEKVWDGWKQLANTARAVKTSIDLSAVLRQGAFYVLSHPEIAIKSFVPMIKALRGQKFARQVNDEILSRPNARLYQKAGLFLAEQDSAHPTKMEEVYMGRWAEKIPGVGASARAYVTFLNKLRADAFDAALEKFGRNGKELTDQELKDLASFINNATGRADLKKFNSEGISSVFFAPRWVASRFNMLTTYPWKVAGLPTAKSKQLDAKLRKHIAGEYARFLVGYGILHSLAVLAFGGDDEDETINWNPLSSDFGKIRVGNTRLDTTAGMSNAIVFTARMMTQHTENTKGEVMPLRYNGDGSNMRFGQRNLGDVVLSFVRSKLAPIPASAWNLMQGTNVVGETYKERAQFMRDSVGMPPWLAENPFLQESLGMGVPLSMADFYDAMQEHGVPKATALQLLATFGVSMNTYDTTSKSSDKKGRPERKERPSRPTRPTRD